MGLNRTSVGLKLLKEVIAHERFDLPQSNQRGIETETPRGGLNGPTVASIEPAWD